jgi:hypothetical protein
MVGQTRASLPCFVCHSLDILLEGNEFPTRTYEAEKIICPLRLEVEKIHACKEDCMLCIGDYAELTEYPFSKTLRFKRRKR